MSPCVALVGHVGNSLLVRGGLEVHLDETARALGHLGVRVLTRLEPGAPRPDLVHFFGTFYGLEDAWRACSAVPRVVTPIILKADEALSPWRGVVDRLRARGPGSLLAARRRMLREAALVMPNSTEEAATARRLGARHVQVLRCGVDLDVFTPHAAPPGTLPAPFDARARALLDRGPFVVCVGRFERRKNQAAVARACRALGVPLICVGRPSRAEPEHTAELAALLAHPDDLWVDAPREAVHWALAHARAHALASRHETIGLVNLEAAACGARPVAIRQPTSEEYLTGFGVLADEPSVPALRAALEQAFARGRLAEGERAALRPLSWEAFARGTLAAYQAVLGRPVR